MEHATKRLFYALKGKGSVVLHIDSGKITEISTSGQHAFSTALPIHVDEFWEINKRTFLKKLGAHNVLPYHLCSSVHYADVATGEADLALECTRKGNLEIAAVFGLIKEAGGDMVALDGSSVGRKKYHEFGQNGYIPVITAASEPLAQNAAKFFRS